MQIAVGTTGVSSASTAGANIAITGLTFQPNAVIVFWTGFSTDAAVQAATTLPMQHGYGFATSTTERFAAVAYGTDGGAGAETARRHANDACVILTDSAGAAQGALDFVNFNATGFTLTVDQQLTTTTRLKWIALRVTDAKAGSFTEPLATGNNPVSAVGFEPDVVFLLSANLATAPSAGAVHALMSFGVMTAGGQFAIAAAAQDGVGTTNTETFSSTSECFAGYDTGVTTVTSDAAFVSMDSDGFTINHTDVSGSANHIFYLALGGFATSTGSFTMSGSLGNLSALTGFGFPPQGAIFFSQFGPFGTSADYAMSFGAAASPSERHTIYAYDGDGVATEAVRQGNHNAEVLLFAGAAAIAGSVDLTSFDTDGMTLAMDNVTAVTGTEQAFYLALGEAPIDLEWYLNTNRPPPGRPFPTQEQRPLAFVVPILELRPSADQTDATWTNELGNNTDLFASIDETFPSDTDYIQSSPGVADLCIIKLATPTVTMLEPLEVRYRYQRKEGTLPIDLRIRLLQGASPIASTTLTNISTTFVAGFFTLSPAEYATISNFADLYLEFRAS